MRQVYINSYAKYFPLGEVKKFCPDYGVAELYALRLKWLLQHWISVFPSPRTLYEYPIGMDCVTAEVRMEYRHDAHEEVTTCYLQAGNMRRPFHMHQRRYSITIPALTQSVPVGY